MFLDFGGQSSREAVLHLRHMKVAGVHLLAKQLPSRKLLQVVRPILDKTSSAN